MTNARKQEKQCNSCSHEASHVSISVSVQLTKTLKSPHVGLFSGKRWACWMKAFDPLAQVLSQSGEACAVHTHPACCCSAKRFHILTLWFRDARSGEEKAGLKALTTNQELTGNTPPLTLLTTQSCSGAFLKQMQP